MKKELPDDILERFALIKKDPWIFIKYCVFTLDQADPKKSIKPFPSDKKYIEFYCRIWQKYPLIAVPKTRRMVMSWTNIALYTWATMFHIGKHYAYVSKKEDDADELVRRSKFIVENIPQDILPKNLIPEWTYKFNVLEFPQLNSKLQGFPQGADQLRQFTFSGIFGDECAFWEKAEDFYSASFPTLEGGGRMTLVSSPGPGFFKRLVFDQMDRGLSPGEHSRGGA